MAFAEKFDLGSNHLGLWRQGATACAQKTRRTLSKGAIACCPFLDGKRQRDWYQAIRAT